MNFAFSFKFGQTLDTWGILKTSSSCSEGQSGTFRILSAHTSTAGHLVIDTKVIWQSINDHDRTTHWSKLKQANTDKIQNWPSLKLECSGPKLNPLGSKTMSQTSLWVISDGGKTELNCTSNELHFQGWIWFSLFFKLTFKAGRDVWTCLAWTRLKTLLKVDESLTGQWVL